MPRMDAIKMYKREALRAARDFGYSSVIIDEIKNAKTQHEISGIMKKS